METINKLSETVILVATAALVVKIADKCGAFNGIKRWWKKVNAEIVQEV